MSLKQKRGERRFVDLRIISILHCCHDLLREVLNFHFKLNDTVPKYRSIMMKSTFLGTVGITFFWNKKFVCLK